MRPCLSSRHHGRRQRQCLGEVGAVLGDARVDDLERETQPRRQFHRGVASEDHQARLVFFRFSAGGFQDVAQRLVRDFFAHRIGHVQGINERQAVVAPDDARLGQRENQNSEHRQAHEQRDRRPRPAQAAVTRGLKPPNPHAQNQQSKRRKIGKLNQVPKADKQATAAEHDQENQQRQNGADRHAFPRRRREIQQPLARVQHLARRLSNPMLVSPIVTPKMR